MTYRREIDSLRALAVVAVILFHYWPSHFASGFLGVDIFFVISGYLISQQIFAEWQQGQFSFTQFYIRRIKRILPVTLTVLATTSVIAMAILIGHDLSSYLRSVIFSVGFTANIFFWRDGGYFGGPDLLKPLLHMWSLSVEEQFYIVFPFLFIAVLKFGRSNRVVIASILLLLIGSLTLNIILVRAGGSVPAFFLTPTRAWQFAVGILAGLIYSLGLKRHTTPSIAISIACVLCGFSIGQDWIVTGFLTTIGTGLFLALRYERFILLDRLVTSSVIRYIGLISFSLYLWHWPFLAFLRYVTIDEPTQIQLVGVLFLTVGLANLSYWTIEKPFRFTFRPRVTVVATGVVSCLLVANSALSLQSRWFFDEADFANRLASSVQTNFRCGLFDMRPYGGSRACVVNGSGNSSYRIALFGNSHAQMYAPAFERLMTGTNESLLVVPLNACLPTVTMNIDMQCLHLAQANLSAVLADPDVKTVVYAMTWDSPELMTAAGEILSDPDRHHLFQSVHDLITVTQNSGRSVYIVGPILTPNEDLASVLSRRIKFGHISKESVPALLRTSRQRFDSRYDWIISEMQKVLADRFILPSERLCDAELCYFGADGRVFFSDPSHLGRLAVTDLADLFKPIVFERR